MRRGNLLAPFRPTMCAALKCLRQNKNEVSAAQLMVTGRQAPLARSCLFLPCDRMRREIISRLLSSGSKLLPLHAEAKSRKICRTCLQRQHRGESLFDKMIAKSWLVLSLETNVKAPEKLFFLIKFVDKASRDSHFNPKTFPLHHESTVENSFNCR